MEGLNINATAKVVITKLDENGHVVGIEEQCIDLTGKEAEDLWRSLQQD